MLDVVFSAYRENGSQTILGKEGKQQKSDMIICLDNAEGLFNSGDIVKGHVSIVLTQEVKIKGEQKQSLNCELMIMSRRCSCFAYKTSVIFLDGRSFTSGGF